MKKVLVINPGSTSTKVAIFHDAEKAVEESISHSREDIAQYATIVDQLPMRLVMVQDFLQAHGVAPKDLDVIVARGGMLPPVQHGAYVVDENLVDILLHRPAQVHASNMAAPIALALAKEGGGVPAYIYDSISVDELIPLARYTGLRGYDRSSFSHTLNTRAVAMATAKEMGLDYDRSAFIVAHLGGGISINIQVNGRMVDVLSSDEGPFSTERAGSLPIYEAIKLCRAEGPDAMAKYEAGTGGLISYLDTNDAREVERRIADGDAKAAEVYEAMAYQIAKYIGFLAPVAEGQIDAIILTGGMSYSQMLTDWIRARVAFIAPVKVVAGEREMQALAEGGLRVLHGEETARVLDTY